MSPDKELRMNVYQEGQRALSTGAPCPYDDWRASTWAKGWLAAKAHREAMLEFELERCIYCGTLTTTPCDEPPPDVCHHAIEAQSTKEPT